MKRNRGMVRKSEEEKDGDKNNTCDIEDSKRRGKREKR